MKIFVALIAIILVPGCGMAGSEKEFSGVWVSKEPNVKARELKLGGDGRFEVKGLPSSIACSDSKVVGDVDGIGTWEYEAEDDRIFLKFSSITNEDCSTPYGVMIFHQPGNKLAAFPDVEKRSGAVIFDFVADNKAR